LVCPPENRKRWTGRRASDAARAAVGAVADRLHGLGEESVSFSPEAMAAYVSHYDWLGEEEWAEPDEDRRAALAKAPRLVMRLALIHHCVARSEDEANGFRSPVGLDSFDVGRKLADWLLNELRRVYAKLGSAGDDLAERVARWANAKGRGGSFTPRDLQRSLTREFHTADQVRAFLDGLAEAGVGVWESEAGQERGRFSLLPESYKCQTDNG
jgi:hypothetical protein